MAKMAKMTEQFPKHTIVVFYAAPNTFTIMAQMSADPSVTYEQGPPIDLDAIDGFINPPPGSALFMGHGITVHDGSMLEVSDWELCTKEDFLHAGLQPPVNLVDEQQLQDINDLISTLARDIIYAEWSRTHKEEHAAEGWTDILVCSLLDNGLTPSAYVKQYEGTANKYKVMYDSNFGRLPAKFLTEEVTAAHIREVYALVDRRIHSHTGIEMHSISSESFYKHNKGSYYYVGGLAFDTERKTVTVVYTTAENETTVRHGTGRVFVRPARMFFDNLAEPNDCGIQEKYEPRFMLTTQGLEWV